jgi:hypothetical protein
MKARKQRPSPAFRAGDEDGERALPCGALVPSSLGTRAQAHFFGPATGSFSSPRVASCEPKQAAQPQ